MSVSRREFLKGGLIAASGVAAGVGLPRVLAAQGKESIKVGVLHSLSGTMAISEGPIKEVVLMAIDAVFPAASELVMLYGGALASGALTHRLDVFGSNQTGLKAYVAIAVAGTVGYLLGGLAGWALGFYGGRPFIVRHGRWLHLDEARLDRAERWFRRWEGWAVLVGRLTPLARSFVSIPAGVFETPLLRYTVLTAIGPARRPGNRRS